MIKRILVILIALSLFSILFYLGYIIIINLTSTPVNLLLTNENTTVPIITDVNYSALQFYPDMRFPKNSFSYNLDADCNLEKRARFQQATEYLQNIVGNINFTETDSEADINVNCSDIIKNSEDRLIAGEGGPSLIVNTSKFYVIEKGTVLLLYQKAPCNNYNIELHELLHVFGFDHSSNKNSIMYNVSYCDQQMTSDIIAEMKRLYSIPSLPELYFSNISAVKKGYYLSFHAEIKNRGLKKANNVSIDVYSGNDMIKSFNMGEINYGEGKIINVENVLIDNNIKKITIRIIGEKQLSSEGNIIELKLP